MQEGLAPLTESQPNPVKEILEILNFELEDMKRLTTNGYSVTGWGLPVPPYNQKGTKSKTSFLSKYSAIA